jgi:hypothetical protein
MRLTIVTAFAMMTSAPSLHAASAKYTFTGGDFVDVSGCFTTQDHVSMTLVFANPIPDGGCNSNPPRKISISDGVNKALHSSARFDGQIYICRQSNKINTWIVSGVVRSKSGAVLFGVDLENDQNGVSDDAVDYTGQCAPESIGSTDAPGTWTRPSH